MIEGLEPQSEMVQSLEAKYMVSTAISLKRIADLLEVVVNVDSDHLGQFIAKVMNIVEPELD